MADEKPTEYVTLVSNDGYEFKLLRSAACIAGTIKKALDPMSGFRENAQNRVELPTIKYVRTPVLPPDEPAQAEAKRKRRAELTVNSGVVLEKVCEYLYYNQKHAESKDVSDMDIPPELCLELLIAADYLDGEYNHRLHAFCQKSPLVFDHTTITWEDYAISSQHGDSRDPIHGVEIHARYDDSYPEDCYASRDTSRAVLTMHVV
ncbi:Elongin-C [Curvularia clavata]|uniref:Elongin-C n=1 Tax=Curvularia clavata TaxID=95742 RepID=A0A9Q8Z194_CURCL|nr:Elongin-C [Curvularia clavata]